jgi:hypothetical protein
VSCLCVSYLCLPPWHNQSTSYLVLEVWDENTFEDDLVGKAVVNFDDPSFSPDVEMSCALDTGGTLAVAVSVPTHLLPPQRTDGGQAGRPAPPAAHKEKGREAEGKQKKKKGKTGAASRGRPAAQAPVVQPKQRRATVAKLAAQHRTIVVEVHQAEGLPNMQTFTDQDPYVAATLLLRDAAAPLVSSGLQVRAPPTHPCPTVLVLGPAGAITTTHTLTAAGVLRPAVLHHRRLFQAGAEGGGLGARALAHGRRGRGAPGLGRRRQRQPPEQGERGTLAAP